MACRKHSIKATPSGKFSFCCWWGGIVCEAGGRLKETSVKASREKLRGPGHSPFLFIEDCANFGSCWNDVHSMHPIRAARRARRERYKRVPLVKWAKGST
eukprot:6455951-Prymnesium_polylepis.1